MNKRAKTTQPNRPPKSSTRQNERNREPEVLEAEAQVGKWLDCRARIASKELTQLHSVKSGILQHACSYKSEKWMQICRKVLLCALPG